jgi:16S rRNA (uracil1498-N3)-methyltransferase
VLRLSKEDTVILFNRSLHVQMVIAHVTSNKIEGTIAVKKENEPWQQTITFFLPILKKESLSTAVYSLVEAGVQEIQLLKTAKVQRSFGGAKEVERLERVIIAAAEQSKNFVFPVIKEPISLEQAIGMMQQSKAYVGQAAGAPIMSIMPDQITSLSHCSLLIGPEGDFTSHEWALIKQSNIVSVQLTPTILRAETAAFCLAAICRSIFSYTQLNPEN